MTSGASLSVTAIVGACGRPDLIAGCVRSLLANTYAPLTVIVVDQNDDDTTFAALQPLLEADARLRHVRTRIKGKSRALNLAIAMCESDVYAFTDDDCIVPPDWVERICAAFQRLPEAAMLFGEVHPPAGHDGRTAYSPSMSIARERRLPNAVLPRVNYLMGACMAVRRQTFERIGLFDEMFGGGAVVPSNEEVDLHLRALRARPSLGVYITPAFHVVHEHGSRPLGAPARQLLRSYEIGKSAMLTKHLLRGDLGAGCQLVIRAFAPIVAGGVNLLRSGRPRGIGQLAPYLAGIGRGVRVARAGKEPRLPRPTHRAGSPAHIAG